MLEQLPLEQLLHPVQQRLVAQPRAAAAAKVLEVPVRAFAGMQPGQQQRVLLIDAGSGDGDPADLCGDRGRWVVRAEGDAAKLEPQHTDDLRLDGLVVKLAGLGVGAGHRELSSASGKRRGILQQGDASGRRE